MNESILDSIKKDLGLTSDYDAFDSDILMYINGVFMTLYQLGVNSVKDKHLSDSDVTWEEYFEDDLDLIDLIHPYTFFKVRLMFDPPTSSYVVESINKQINEYEWRINIQAEGGFDLEDV